MDYIFLFSVLCIAYTYLLYPMLLYIESFFYSKRINTTESPLPSVSVVLAVRDAAHLLESRIHNLTTQDFPMSLLEIIIVSDGSHDNIHTIIRQLTNQMNEAYSTTPTITFFHYGQPRGKAYAINMGANIATGDILLFIDARQRFHYNTISSLVRNFSDPEIGSVSGQLLLENTFRTDSSHHQEIASYWRYEKLIRKLESLTGSTVGGTGAILAIRKYLFRCLPEGALLDDVITPMHVVNQGYRCVFEPNAVAYDSIHHNLQYEWGRKVRTMAGNWQLLSLFPEWLNPRANRLWFRFISHKVLRLTVPFLLPIVLSTTLAGSGLLWNTLLLAQVTFYFAAFLAWQMPSFRRIRALRACYLLLFFNIAILVGFFYWITGRCHLVWHRFSPLDKQ